MFFVITPQKIIPHDYSEMKKKPSLPVVCRLMSYLRYLCLFGYSGVQHILCCVFVLIFFVLLSVSLNCPF